MSDTLIGMWLAIEDEHWLGSAVGLAGGLLLGLVLFGVIPLVWWACSL